MKFRLLLVLLLMAGLSAVSAEVEFADLTINSENQTLFNAVTDAPEYREYTTAFTATIAEDVSRSRITQLTYYPEQISYLPSSGQLQIHNRFGLFRTDENLENIQPLEAFENFVGGSDIRTGKISPVGVSPDGRYLMYFTPTGSAYGDLILSRLSDGRKYTVSRNVELSLASLPVSWSPESDFFIYQKAGNLYYFSVAQYESNRLLSEEFRSIGKGQMSSVRWGAGNELYYMSGTVVYQILGVEFFTRSLYQEFLKIGRIVGKIPVTFDPNFDRFWISPDGTQILLDKGGRNIYLYFLTTNDYANSQDIIELPYLFLPRNSSVTRVLWSSEGLLTLMVEGSVYGVRQTSLYRLDLRQPAENYSFTRLATTDVRDIVLSPDESTVALLRPNTVELFDYSSWTSKQVLESVSPHHLVFVNDSEIIVSGHDITELINLGDESRKFIAFSRADEVGYSSSNGEILVRAGSESYAYDAETGRWFARDVFDIAPRAVSTGEYRVYLENLSSGSYTNMIMIRQIARRSDSLGTVSLFDPPVKIYEPFPDREEEVSFTTFRHGSRIRTREVALVFNAIDSATGLANILAVLDDYDIKATFFLNGDFISRYPGAVQEIASSGHEVGSLFSMYFNMSDSRFQVTRDFVRQGLANNEDDYFAATGEELSLLWHAPYYYVSPEIIAASQAMNYSYIGRDVDSLDWVPTYDESGRSRLYYPSAQLIERIIAQKKPGSIISMTIGTPGDDRSTGGREDYLFRNLDILINTLLEQGYDMVPVSALMDRAR